MYDSKDPNIQVDDTDSQAGDEDTGIGVAKHVKVSLAVVGVVNVVVSVEDQESVVSAERS